MGQKVAKINTQEDAKKKIHTYLVDKRKQYEKVQEEEVIGEFASVLYSKHKDINAIQKQTGYKTTSYGKKDMIFSKVLTKHIELVREELEHCTIFY